MSINFSSFDPAQSFQQTICTQFSETFSRKSSKKIAHIVKPEAGCSGFTFLCSLVDIESSSNNIVNFILKWSQPDSSKSQVLCSRLFDFFQCSAPKIVEVPPRESQALKRIAQRVSPALESSDYSLVFMKAFKATTFKSCIELGYFDDLTKSEQKKIWTHLGETILFDLITGNNDRLFRFDDKGDLKVHFNSGNIMLEVPYNEDGTRRVLRQIHLIDNDTDRNILKDFSTKEEDEEDFCLEIGAVHERILAVTPDAKKLQSEQWLNTLKNVTIRPKKLLKYATAGVSRAFIQAIPPKSTFKLPKASFLQGCLKKGFQKGMDQIKACKEDELYAKLLNDKEKIDDPSELLNFVRKCIGVIKSGGRSDFSGN